MMKETNFYIRLLLVWLLCYK